MELDGTGWNWMEVDGSGWKWMVDVFLPVVFGSFLGVQTRQWAVVGYSEMATTPLGWRNWANLLAYLVNLGLTYGSLTGVRVLIFSFFQ